MKYRLRKEFINIVNNLDELNHKIYDKKINCEINNIINKIENLESLIDIEIDDLIEIVEYKRQRY